jgi:hypothetical protein
MLPFAAVLLLAACHGAPRTDARPPDLVLVLVNGLRADPPGGRSAAGILLDSLDSEPGLVFDRAYVQSSNAFMGLSSLLTGRYAAAIPICRPVVPPSAAGEQGDGDRPWCAAIPEDRPLLPDVLELWGYRTALYTQGDAELEGMGWGFGERFEIPVDAPSGAGRERVASWWTENAASPRFLVVSLLLPDRDFDGAVGLENRARRRFREEQGTSGDPNASLEGYAIDPAVRDAVFKGYIGAAGRAALSVRELLRAAPAGDRPRWVFLSSLQGLNLAELGGSDANQLLTGGREHLVDRILHVPLAVWPPDGEESGPPKHVPGIVELLDLAPSIYELAGATPPAVQDGHALGLRGREVVTGNSAYAEYGDMLALRKDRYLLAYRCYHHGGSTLEPELTAHLAQDFLLLQGGPGGADDRFQCSFRLDDVETDPLQETPLALADHLEAYRDLAQVLLATRGGPAAPPSLSSLGPAAGEQLKSPRIGYW